MQQVRQQVSYSCEANEITNRTAFALRFDQSRVRQFLEMKCQRRGRNVQTLGYFAGGATDFTGPDKQAKDVEPRFLGKGGQRSYGGLDFHISIIVKLS